MTKILTIGNSFSGNALKYMNDFVAADDSVELCFARADLGGCSLEKHWNLVEQCDMLPDVKPYMFSYNNSEHKEPMSLKEILLHDKWDYVTMQQVSNKSWIKESFEPYFSKLHCLVRELAPQAEIVIHQTWAYRKDADLLKEFGISQEEMFDKLKDNYAEMAEKHSCRIIPSGQLFQNARDVLNFQVDKSYDFENPVPMKLPDQTGSLIAGYWWKTGNTATGKVELGFDCKHANNKGCFLIGALWFEFFSGRSIMDNSFVIDDISRDELKIFKQLITDMGVRNG